MITVQLHTLTEIMDVIICMRHLCQMLHLCNPVISPIYLHESQSSSHSDNQSPIRSGILSDVQHKTFAVLNPTAKFLRKALFSMKIHGI